MVNGQTFQRSELLQKLLKAEDSVREKFFYSQRSSFVSLIQEDAQLLSRDLGRSIAMQDGEIIISYSSTSDEISGRSGTAN